MTKMADDNIDPHQEFLKYYQNKGGDRTCCNCLKTLNYHLIKFFYLFGYKVGQRPVPFVVIPSLISFIFVSGLLFLSYEENPTTLFVPTVAPFIKEQKVIERLYPINYTYYYDPVRFTRFEGHSRILVSSQDEKSIFRQHLWPDIMSLYDKVTNITITTEDGRILQYKDICATWRGKCMRNPALNINQIVAEVEKGKTRINYPMMLVPLIVPQVLGGAVFNRSAGVIEDAKAIMLGFFLNIQTQENIDIAHQWELELLKMLKKYHSDNIKLSFYSSRTIQDELRVKMDSSLPYIPITGFVMVTACMVLLWTSDVVRSKPFIGLIGIISSLMSAGSSFGFLVYCGATYTRLNVVALFLVLGIGVDDIFVAISAWQKTTSKESVPKRLAHTYADAAVSVTITSLTNALAFAVGITTPTLIVMSFCLYCCTTIIFAYIWFVTFCGGFLAIAGYIEESGRHCLLLVKVKDAPNQASSLMKKFYNLFCSSPSLGINSARRDEANAHVVSLFFRDVVGSLFYKKWFKVCVMITYVIYLIGALYGLVILEEGMLRHRMARDDSYLVDFTLDDAKYFRQLPYSVQVVVEGKVNYSDPMTQQKLLALQAKYENSPFGSETIYSQFWLRSFLKRLQRRRDWQEIIQDEASFIKVLQEHFLRNPDNKLRLDIKFNDNNTEILASRMILQTAGVKDVNDDVRLMNTFRKISAESEFNVTCFHLLFSLFDQHSMLRPLAIQSIIIAVFLVIVVSLFFIPDMRGSIAIASSVLSIAVGLMGYMAYWNVNLDHVSSGSIFMCIGFSVDFSAHITYTYLTSKEKTSMGRIKETLFNLGLPIMQGGLTTILSVITFVFIPGYGYRTFFKTIFLVTLFASFHSLILIPLLLSHTENLFSRCKKHKFSEKGESSKGTVNGVSGKTFRQICTDLTTTINELPPQQNGVKPAKQNGELKNKFVSTTILNEKKGNEIVERGIQNQGFTNDES